MVSSLIVLLHSTLAPSIIICDTKGTAMISNHGSSNKAYFKLTIGTSHSFLYSSIILLLKEIMLEQKLDSIMLCFWVYDKSHVTVLSTNGVLQQPSGYHAVYTK